MLASNQSHRLPDKQPCKPRLAAAQLSKATASGILGNFTDKAMANMHNPEQARPTETASWTASWARTEY